VALRFLPSTPFRTDLDAAVDAYFATTGRSRRDQPAMYLKTAILFTWLAGAYVGLVFFAHSFFSAFPLAIALGLAMAGIGFNVQHDGGHGAYSNRRAVNRLMAFSIDLLGGSSYFWSYKHNIAHHTFPNVTGADDDLEVGTLARLTPHRRWYPLHRLQHLYMWILYACLVIRWQLIDDFHSLIDPGIGQTHVPRPRGWDLARFWLGKATFLTLAFVVPMTVCPIGAVIAFYVITQLTVGLVLATTFQLAHCVQEATFPVEVEGRIEREWAAHQLDTTVDFGHGNRLLTWYVGGLNYQIEHHLFPQVCHVHYPALAEIVERVAAAHGIRYRRHHGTWAALRSHYRWLRQLARKPAGATA
jgi:linoleoyl-CoA desaturase